MPRQSIRTRHELRLRRRPPADWPPLAPIALRLIHVATPQASDVNNDSRRQLVTPLSLGITPQARAPPPPVASPVRALLGSSMLQHRALLRLCRQLPGLGQAVRHVLAPHLAPRRALLGASGCCRPCSSSSEPPVGQAKPSSCPKCNGDLKLHSKTVQEAEQREVRDRIRCEKAPFLHSSHLLLLLVALPLRQLQELLRVALSGGQELGARRRDALGSRAERHGRRWRRREAVCGGRCWPRRINM
eukprot:scaffold375_cov210-Pinguiococcus_pyrenoidosus.AAC.8